MYVQIETAGEYCRGTTVGDLLGFSGHVPNADVLMDVDPVSYTHLDVYKRQIQRRQVFNLVFNA